MDNPCEVGAVSYHKLKEGLLSQDPGILMVPSLVSSYSYHSHELLPVCLKKRVGRS